MTMLYGEKTGLEDPLTSFISAVWEYLRDEWWITWGHAHILGEVQQCNPHCLVECPDVKADSAKDIKEETSICLKK